MVKQYCMATTIAAIALAATPPTDDELRGLIATTSDVPPDRYDACMAELKQMLPDLAGMVEVMTACAGGVRPTAREIETAMAGSMWKDDDLKTATVNLRVVDEDENEVANANVTRKLD